MAYGYTTTTTRPNSAIQALIEQFSTKEAEARASNIERKEAIESIFDEIIARYGPGGTYGASAEAMLERQKVRDVGATTQRDISRGMYGIRPYEQEWEATTGAAARLKLEDIKMERLSSAQLGKAGFLEGIEETYPDYGALMQAVSAAGAGGETTTTTPWGTSGSRAGDITSLPGRAGRASGSATVTLGTGKETKAGAKWTPPDIQMGPGYGPMFEGPAPPESFYQGAYDILAGIDPEAEWRAFKRENPFYMRGKEKWMASRGYTGAGAAQKTSTPTTPTSAPAMPTSFYQGAYDILAGKTPQDLRKLYR